MFKVKDYRGNLYSVDDAAPDAGEKEPAPKDVKLTADEITALKSFVASIPDVLALLDAEKKEHKGDEKAPKADKKDDKKDFAEDELDIQKSSAAKDGDTDVESETGEEEIVTDDSACNDCDDTMVHDSIRKSFGSNEAKVNDSADDEISREDEIADSWKAHYNGGKK
jgi:hypothetical protein